MMAAEGDFFPPLKFHTPSWYPPQKRWPEGLCFFHDRYCEQVKHDLKRVYQQTPAVEEDDDDDDDEEEEEEEEEDEEKKKEEEERMIKMRNFLEELRREREANFLELRREREVEVKKEDEEEEERKQMEEEEERKQMEEEEERRKLMEEKKKKEEMWKQWELLQMKESPPVEWTIGEKYDIRCLLSSPSRNYLIRNTGDKVRICTLSGKYVLLYFWRLTSEGLYYPHDTDLDLNADLEEIYKAHNPKDFEVVFVALGNNKVVFEDAFSRVPWLAIPHDDQETRDGIKSCFAIPYLISARAILFGPDGTVLLKDCKADFRIFGAEGFPFSEKRKEEIYHEADVLWDKLVLRGEKFSLTELLGNSLISSEGNQESTSLLKGKTVGLYFFEVSPRGFGRTRELLDIWNLAKDKKFNGKFDDFEIVFINEVSANLSFAKTQFQNKFNHTIPWYSLPFDGRKLCQVFKLYGFQSDDGWNNAGFFIMLKPDKYQPLSYFALDILKYFGIAAYPFTLQNAVTIEKNNQQNNLVLGELLSPLAPLYRVGSTGLKEYTTVSKLLGKRVFLFFATHSCYEAGSFLPEMKRMYDEKMGTDGEFEIIYISLDCNESPSSFPMSIRGMSWLVHSYVPDFAASLAERIFKLPFQLPAIAAFGRNGYLKTKESNLAFKKKWQSKYPFIEADLSTEVLRELLKRHKWDLDILKEDIFF